MFVKSSLLPDLNVRTKWKQEAQMQQKPESANNTDLAVDLVGMIALIVLLFVGLHLPLLV